MKGLPGQRLWLRIRPVLALALGAALLLAQGHAWLLRRLLHNRLENAWRQGKPRGLQALGTLAAAEKRRLPAQAGSGLSQTVVVTVEDHSPDVSPTCSNAFLSCFNVCPAPSLHAAAAACDAARAKGMARILW